MKIANVSDAPIESSRDSHTLPDAAEEPEFKLKSSHHTEIRNRMPLAIEYTDKRFRSDANWPHNIWIHTRHVEIMDEREVLGPEVRVRTERDKLLRRGD
jgi:hypothetical protein